MYYFFFFNFNLTEFLNVLERALKYTTDSLESLIRTLRHLFIWKVHPNVSKLSANINITIIKNIFKNNAIINAYSNCQLLGK